MMKLPVYDKINKSRLLGTLNYDGKLTGYRLRVASVNSLPRRFMYLQPPRKPVVVELTHVSFDVDFQSERNIEQIDEATRKIIMIERKVLLTTEKLETLMKLDTFFLPGETYTEQSYRLRHY